MSKYTEDDLRVDLENKKYEFGWETKIDYEDFPIGLNEDIIRAISAKRRAGMDDGMAFGIFQNLAENGRAGMGKY
jgi:hypothetical protein